MVIAMLSVQAGASVAKQLFSALGPYAAAMLRLSIAAAILCAVRRPWLHRLTGAQRLAILIYGGALGAMNLSFYLALARIPLGVAVALEFSGPLAVALLGSRRIHDLVWIALSLGGFLCLIPRNGTGTTLDPLGVYFALLAGACWALYIIFGQRAGASVPSGTASALGMLVAACVVIPICAWHISKISLTWRVGSLIVAVAVLSSVIPYSLEMIALQRMPTKTFGILMSLEPAIGAVFGLGLLHEYLRGSQWFGITCVMLASIGSVATMQTPVVVVDPG